MPVDESDSDTEQLMELAELHRLRSEFELFKRSIASQFSALKSDIEKTVHSFSSRLATCIATGEARRASAKKHTLGRAADPSQAKVR